MPSLGGATGWVKSDPLGPPSSAATWCSWTSGRYVHQLAAPGAVRARVVAGRSRRRVARRWSPPSSTRLPAPEGPGHRPDSSAL